MVRCFHRQTSEVPSETTVNLKHDSVSPETTRQIKTAQCQEYM